MPDTKQQLLMLIAVPADLMQALTNHYDVVMADELASESDRTQFRVAVTTAMRGLTAEDLTAFPSLELVLSQGIGLDRIDLTAARDAGVAVSITPNILTEDVADYAIGLMYGITRRVVEADRYVRSGEWGKRRISMSSSLYQKHMGIVGMGRIGQAIARRAAGLGMRVSYTGRAAKPDVPYSFVPQLNALARAADVLVLACPGGAETHHLCNAETLAALGPEGFLVNIARGAVVDEAALLDALEAGAIAGAGLDVFATEPALNPRFLPLDNVVLTPHAASLTVEVRRRLIGCMLDDAAAHWAGHPLKYRAN